MYDKNCNTMSGDLKGAVVSSATLRPEDLIPSFVAALRSIEADNVGIMESLDQMEREIDDPEYYNKEDSVYDLDYLFDLLNACSPDGYYFGANPGDGACFGFWEAED